MNKLLYFALFFTLSLLTMACDEDSFTQVVKVDIPDHESAISINALFSDKDTSLQMLVSNSLGILDTAMHASMKTAKVELYEDNALLHTFNFNENTYQFDAKLETPLNGTAYRIEVAADGYNTVIAEQELPTTIPILDAEVNDDGTISGEGDRVDEIILKFKDPAGQENYYAIQGYIESFYYDQQQGDTLYFRNKFYMESFDQFIQFGDQYDIVFTDGAFDGREYTLKLYTFYDLPFGVENGRVVLQLISLTRDAYLYDRSLNQYYNALDNPFAEPVVVHNNINEGYGIFALSVIDEVTIELE